MEFHGLSRNQGGKAIPALAAAIRAYRASFGLITRTIIGRLGEDLLMLFRMPMIIVVNPDLRNPQKHTEEIMKSHRDCLINRETGNRVI
jgi:hypothetical protein